MTAIAAIGVSGQVLDELVTEQPFMDGMKLLGAVFATGSLTGEQRALRATAYWKHSSLRELTLREWERAVEGAIETGRFYPFPLVVDLKDLANDHRSRRDTRERRVALTVRETKRAELAGKPEMLPSERAKGAERGKEVDAD